MDTSEYWGEKLADYAEKDWSKCPSIFAKQVAPFFSNGGNVLELAGGQGNDSRWFASEGFNVTYSDFVDDVVQKIKEQTASEPNLACATVDLSQDLPFSPESFDVVYSHMGLHYFDQKETRRIIESIHRILKPQGIIALLLNTIDDPEIEEYGYKQIEPHYLEDPRSGLNKSYFSIDYIQELTQDLFEAVLLDDHGKTHKDEVETLVRFVGRKK